MKCSAMVLIFSGVNFGLFIAAGNAVSNEDPHECVFRIVHPASQVTYSKSKPMDMPEADVGACRIDSRNGVCHYEYWHGGIYSLPWAVVQQGKRVPDPTIGSSRAWLKSAAGFDGMSYWLALFEPYEKDEKNGRIAAQIYVAAKAWPDEKTLSRAPAPLSRRWDDHVILHKLAQDLSLTSLVEESLPGRLRDCPECNSYPDGSYGVHAARRDDSVYKKGVLFRYRLYLDLKDSPCRIAKCEVESTSHGGSGTYPFPFPMRRFVIVKTREADDRRPDYSWRQYEGSFTKVIRFGE